MMPAIQKYATAAEIELATTIVPNDSSNGSASAFVVSDIDAWVINPTVQNAQIRDSTEKGSE